MAADSGLQAYLKQINRAPLLTPEEEKELARTIQQGLDASAGFQKGEVTLAERESFEVGAQIARERMVRSNLRLVVNIAKRYAKRGMPLNDLINEGNLGLIRAVEGFDPDLNTRFSTYASWWIKQAIKRSLINGDKPVHIPAYMVELISRYRRGIDTFLENERRQPTLTELSELLELSEKKVRDIHDAVKAVSAPTQGPEEEESSAADAIPDQSLGTPEDTVSHRAETQRIRELLGSLDEREAAIVRMRYGLDGKEPMTLKEIGKSIGLTRERVRQIEADTLKKLRHAMAE